MCVYIASYIGWGEGDVGLVRCVGVGGELEVLILSLVVVRNVWPWPR